MEQIYGIELSEQGSGTPKLRGAFKSIEAFLTDYAAQKFDTVLTCTRASPIVSGIGESGRASECHSYSKPVTLTGYYATVTFPGPPNYESVRAGDMPERVGVLFLITPQCLAAGSPLEPAVSSFEVVQFSCPLEDVGEGEFISVSGGLGVAETGHHRTRVLICASRATPQ